MTLPLLVRREARADIIDAYQWYEQRSVGLGREFIRTLRARFASVSREPQRFPIVVDDIRRAPLSRFPYFIYFVDAPAAVVVIGVLHGRRNPERWQGRR